MRLPCVLVLCVLQKAAFCKDSFVVACLTYKNVQFFWNRPVHEFYSLKASQMSKVRASSHEYPHVEKKSRAFKGEARIVTIKYTQ